MVLEERYRSVFLILMPKSAYSCVTGLTEFSPRLHHILSECVSGRINLKVNFSDLRIEVHSLKFGLFRLNETWRKLLR